MSNSVRIAIEVSRFMRRLMRDLFLDGSGIGITDTLYLEGDGDEVGIIDEFDPSSAQWEWANAVLMLLRTFYGILENAESEEIGDL